MKHSSLLLFFFVISCRPDLGEQRAIGGIQREPVSFSGSGASDTQTHGSMSGGGGSAGASGGGSTGSPEAETPSDADSAPSTADPTLLADSDLSIDAQGFLRGSNVHQDLGGPAMTNERGYSGGSPKGIILHKTAGRTCNPNNTVADGYEKPHIYICQDGRVIVNGSFDKPRTSAEKAHNDWSLNIEFESPYEQPETPLAANRAVCARRGEKTQGGYGHCYKPLTPQQLAMGQNLIKLLSARYQIPSQLALPVTNEAEYTAAQTSILPNGVATAGNPRSVNVSQMNKGVLPSFWTMQRLPDRENHDDGPSWRDLQGLGLLPSLAESDDVPPTDAGPELAGL